MVQLYLNGNLKSEIIREYDLTPSSLTKWINSNKARDLLKKKIIEQIMKTNLSITPFKFCYPYYFWHKKIRPNQFKYLQLQVFLI